VREREGGEGRSREGGRGMEGGMVDGREGEKGWRVGRGPGNTWKPSCGWHWHRYYQRNADSNAPNELISH